MNKQKSTDKKSNNKERPARSKCAYIDSLLAAGGMTMEQIAKKACAKYPGSNYKSTLRTCNARPFHMRAKGLKPVWEKASTAK